MAITNVLYLNFINPYCSNLGFMHCNLKFSQIVPRTYHNISLIFHSDMNKVLLPRPLYRVHLLCGHYQTTVNILLSCKCYLLLPGTSGINNVTPTALTYYIVLLHCTTILYYYSILVHYTTILYYYSVLLYCTTTLYCYIVLVGVYLL